jgi:hypothetical protein
LGKVAEVDDGGEGGDVSRVALGGVGVPGAKADELGLDGVEVKPGTKLGGDGDEVIITIGAESAPIVEDGEISVEGGDGIGAEKESAANHVLAEVVVEMDGERIARGVAEVLGDEEGPGLDGGIEATPDEVGALFWAANLSEVRIQSANEAFENGREEVGFEVGEVTPKSNEGFLLQLHEHVLPIRAVDVHAHAGINARGAAEVGFHGGRKDAAHDDAESKRSCKDEARQEDLRGLTKFTLEEGVEDTSGAGATTSDSLQGGNLSL